MMIVLAQCLCVYVCCKIASPLTSYTEAGVPTVHCGGEYIVLISLICFSSLGLVDRRLILDDWFLECITVGDVLVEDSEYLVVEQLIDSNTIHHFLQGLRERGMVWKCSSFFVPLKATKMSL